jgi:hypothetical protein
MENLNLNIDSYKPEELIKLFQLKKDYNEEEVTSSKKRLEVQLNKLVTSGDLGGEKNRQILFFIDTVAQMLINKKNSEASKAGTWSEKPVPITEVDGHVLISNPNELLGKEASLLEGRVGGLGVNAPPGWLNPINVRSFSRSVNIDTRFRKDYYKTLSTNFTITLPEIERRVTTMRIADIEMPTSWYAVSKTQGNTTFLLIAKEQYRTNNDGVNLGPGSFGGPAEARLVLGTGVADVGPIGSAWNAYPGFIPIRWAWKVQLSDGNYENAWASESNAFPIQTAINNALSLAILGAIDNQGEFKAAPAAPEIPNSPAGASLPRRTIGDSGDGVVGMIPFADLPSTNGLMNTQKPASGAAGPDNQGAVRDGTINPNIDLTFTVDRTSGKSILSKPLLTRSVDPADPNVFLGSFGDYNGLIVRFNVDIDGNLSMEENIQLRLGWLLGNRVAEYEMITSTFDNNIPEGPNNSPIQTGYSMISEGPLMVQGPKYGFIAINDFQQNFAGGMIATYGEHTAMDKHIIARINLASVLIGNGVYNSVNDPGLSTQLNRSREYFGPVNIQRLTITVYDEYGRILDLNNMDWSMTLAFEHLYT